ncbi:MAG: hypothetical protein IT280_05905 [Ignavibacteria bacterium]|nr:hypothetical protein [Ignavibacteria bacterium]
MKNKLSFKPVLSVLLLVISISAISKAQDMTPPKPVESSYFDKWVGTWVGENVYDGLKGKQSLTAAWDLNHQFLVINVTGTIDNNPDFKYKGTGYYTIDNNGKYIGYWFDVFGFGSITQSNGKISRNKMEGSVTAKGYTGTEWAEFKSDNEVEMNTKGTYEYNGQKIPSENNVTYRKK